MIAYPYIHKCLNQTKEMKQSNFGYWGDLELGTTHAVILSVNRDSDSLYRSNFESLSRDLSEKFGEESAESWAIFRCSHWAVGWVEYIAINVTNESVAEFVEEVLENLDGYPVYDEDHFSQLESEEYDRDLEESWHWIREEHKTAKFPKRSSTWFNRLSDWLEDSGFGMGYSEGVYMPALYAAAYEFGWVNKAGFDDEMRGVPETNRNAFRRIMFKD